MYEVKVFSEEDSKHVIYEVDKIINVSDSSKNILVCFNDTTIDLHSAFVLEILLFGVVVQTHLLATSEESSLNIALSQHLAELLAEYFLKVSFGILFLQV